MKSPLVSALAVAVAGLVGCDGTLSTMPTALSTESAPRTPVAPTAIKIIVSGQTSLSVVGETSRLTAQALFTDGSVRGITGEARWTSSDPSVIAVSATGLVTAVGVGRAYVSAMYDTKSAGQTVEVLAPPLAEFLRSS